MLPRLVIQSWRHNFRRKILAVVTVLFAAALISALLAVSLEVGDKMSREMKSYGANILIEPAGQAVLPALLGENAVVSGQDLLNESDLPNINGIFWRNNIIGYAPLLTGKAEVGARSVAVTGTFFDKRFPLEDEPNYHTGQKVISPYWRVTGEWPNDERSEALAGRKLAEEMGWKINDSRTLVRNNRKVTVRLTGIVETGGAEDRQLLMPLVLAQELFGQAGKVQSVRISAMTVPETRLSRKARRDIDSLNAAEYDSWYCTAYVSSIAKQLEEALPGTAVRPIWQVAASEGAVIEKVQLLLVVATFAALLAASMGIASLTTTTILERTQEIGLMKALDARLWQIFALFYAESALNGLLGGLIGCAVGWGLAQAIGWELFDSAIGFHWIVVPSVLVISIVIALLGTWIPARRIASLYPAEVLYGRH